MKTVKCVPYGVPWVGQIRFRREIEEKAKGTQEIKNSLSLVPKLEVSVRLGIINAC
jgi:hypothetical protein